MAGVASDDVTAVPSPTPCRLPAFLTLLLVIYPHHSDCQPPRGLWISEVHQAPPPLSQEKKKKKNQAFKVNTCKMSGETLQKPEW